jgi:hypothetical protein
MKGLGRLLSCTLLLGTAAGLFSGCASPGPPRPPTLHLPSPVRDLTALREGDTVEIRFTLPVHTTDGLPLRPAAVFATLCRGLEAQPCVPIPELQNQQLAVSTTNAATRAIVWHDTLPPALAHGTPRSLAYRLELSNTLKRSAGWSTPAYTLAGSPPSPVESFSAQGTRKGILLQWQTGATPTPASSDILVRRDLIGPPPANSKAPAEPVWLDPHAALSGSTALSLDTTAQPNTSYRYTAVRRQFVQVGEQKFEVRSAPSAPVEITLRTIYPPAAPTDLTAAAFTESGRFAVDLVWQPVDDPDLAGYNILRETLDATGTPTSSPQLLNPTPVNIPGFHDATATPGQRYRYSVRTVDHEGNQSPAITTFVEPAPPQ